MAAAAAAAAIAASTSTTAEGTLQSNSNSIRTVDIRLLSQSELNSLSLHSLNPNSVPFRCDDVVIPKINRSVFNESAGSRKQTYSRLRLDSPSSSSRRTLHLRPTNAALLNSDPEKAENYRIIALLKQLFVSDMDYVDLVPIKIDYPQSQTQSQSLPNVGHKRKRGRPRKNENLENDWGKRESMMEINVVDVNENAEDRDMELLNRDGVAVDFLALGAVDHPFWEEIRRRSEGLETEEELLGFLKGLDGRWGSQRKKRRICDASEFGNALPIGWKLLLSVKKKNGRVWLFCRRYISPSGRQFVSCKEVSMYLLSLHGAQDTYPHSSAQHSDAEKLISVAIADLTTQDNVRKESVASLASLPAFASTSDNTIIQKAEDWTEDRVGEISHCNDCNLTFSKRDELLQHQSSVHRRNRYKNAASITDGVIIKDGKYECQFCHKTFSERHRYNGHIGAHVRFQDKMVGEPAGGGTREPVDPISCGEIPVQYTIMQGLVGSDHVEKNSNSFQEEGLNSYNKEDQVANSNEANANIRGVGEVTDVVIRSPYSVAEVLSAGNENKSFREVSDHAHMSGCASETCDDGSNLQGRRSGNCSPLPFGEKTLGIVNALIENSASIENPKQDMVSEKSLFDSNNHVEACDADNGHVYQTSNELKLDGDSFAINDSIFDVDNDVSGLVDVLGHASNHCAVSNKDALCGRKMEVPESDPLSNSLCTLTSDSAVGTEQDIKLGFSSASLPGTDKQFAAEDHVSRVFSSALGEHKEEPCATVLFGQSGISQVSSAGYELNMDYPTSANQFKLSDTENAGKHELSLSFTNLPTELHTKFSSFEQERYPTESFNVQPVLHQTSADQTRLDVVNSNIRGDFKQGSPFGIEFLASSFNDRTNEHSSKFNMVPLGEEWNGSQGGKEGTSGHDLMIDFGSSSLQSGDYITADKSWTTGHTNIFQGSNAASNPRVELSSCFSTYQLISDKGHEGSSGVSESHHIHDDILRVDRTEPVEYSFMGEERRNSLLGEPTIFSNTTNIEQRLDPSFWIGKDGLVQNTAESNRVTSVCVWCRNEFYHELVQPGIHTEAIGSMCPSCSTGIPGQFNV